MNRFRISLLAIATTLAAPAAHAQAPMTLDQAQAAAAHKFDVLDTDHDGVLDSGELKGTLAKKRFARADTDHDNKIDKVEWTALVARQFKRADKDHDGTLDAAELKTGAGKTLAKLTGS